MVCLLVVDKSFADSSPKMRVLQNCTREAFPSFSFLWRKSKTICSSLNKRFLLVCVLSALTLKTKPIECVKDLPRFLAELKASQLRREQYQQKEAAKRGLTSDAKTEVSKPKSEAAAAVPVLEKVPQVVAEKIGKTEEKQNGKEKEETEMLTSANFVLFDISHHF